MELINGSDPFIRSQILKDEAKMSQFWDRNSGVNFLKIHDDVSKNTAVQILQVEDLMSLSSTIYIPRQQYQA